MSGQRVPIRLAAIASEWTASRSPLPTAPADHVRPPSDPGVAGSGFNAEGPLALVVEPCKAHASALGLALQRVGFRVEHAASAEDVADYALRSAAFQLILSELKLPGQSGLGLLRRVQTSCPDTPFFMLSGQPDVPSSVTALQLGAAEYLTKPLDEARLTALCLAATVRSRSLDRCPSLATDAAPAPLREEAELDARSPAMRGLIRRLPGLSQSAAPVLLRGEPGTGKRLVAQVLHRLSARAAGPLVIVRPEQLKPDLLGPVLWGQTPAGSSAGELPGAVVQAGGGSLLITEIERLSAADRWLLARLITRGLYRPVGSTLERAVAVRVFLTTTQPAALQAGEFEEELLPGLRCIELRVPPLRERIEDVLPLALRLLRELAAAQGRAPLELHPESARQLLAYRWPGNGTELRATLAAAAQRAVGSQLGPELLPAALTGDPATLGRRARAALQTQNGGLLRRDLRREVCRLAAVYQGHRRPQGPILTLVRALSARQRQRQRQTEARPDGL